MAKDAQRLMPTSVRLSGENYARLLELQTYVPGKDKHQVVNEAFCEWWESCGTALIDIKRKNAKKAEAKAKRKPQKKRLATVSQFPASRLQPERVVPANVLKQITALPAAASGVR